MSGDAFSIETLPSGLAVRFDEEDHSYWRAKEDRSRGRRFTGVTTAVKSLDIDPKLLMRWSARTNGIGIGALVEPILLLDDLEEMREGLRFLLDHEEIWTRLEEAHLTYEDVRDRKAVVGTNVHKHALHALARGEPVPDFDAMTAEERGYASGVVKFWLEKMPKVVCAEQIVADEKLGIAGRLDLIAEISGMKGEGVIDAKTGGYIATAYHGQVTGYRYLAKVCEVAAPKWGLILQVFPDGEYELIPAEATIAEFKVAVAAYRAFVRIEREARKKRLAR